MDLLQLEQWKNEIIKEACQFLDGGTSIFHTIQRINRLHDLLQQQTMRAVEKGLSEGRDLPSFSYCWVEMGSGGREERTLWTDQDNGIIYQCAQKDESAVIVFLRELAENVVRNLSELGYPLCPGGVMASNPRWLQPVEGWKRICMQWSNTLSLDHIRYLLIASDLRPVYGELALADEVKHWLYQNVRYSPLFPRIAAYALHQKVPLGILKNLLTEKYGPHSGKFNLKEGGYYQLVSLVRILAFHSGIASYSTKARMDALVELGVISSLERWEYVLSFLLKARLKNHLQLLKTEEKAHDYIVLSNFSKTEVKQFKEHLCFLRSKQKYWERALGKGGGG